MNRVDRLFAILLRLQAARRVHADDMAAAFEVSKQAIYRALRPRSGLTDRLGSGAAE